MVVFPAHMEDAGKQAGCLRSSEIDISAKAQGNGPGSMNGERQAWQPAEGVPPAQGPSRESPSHQIRGDGMRKED